MNRVFWESWFSVWKICLFVKLLVLWRSITCELNGANSSYLTMEGQYDWAGPLKSFRAFHELASSIFPLHLLILISFALCHFSALSIPARFIVLPSPNARWAIEKMAVFTKTTTVCEALRYFVSQAEHLICGEVSNSQTRLVRVLWAVVLHCATLFDMSHWRRSFVV